MPALQAEKVLLIATFYLVPDFYASASFSDFQANKST